MSNPLESLPVATWADLLASLQTLTPEQLQQPAQVVQSHPVYEHVHSAKPVVCIGSIDKLGLLYVRSSKDNRRRGDEIVLFVDGNPFGEDGAIAYEMTDDDLFGEGKPIYPRDHSPDADWTGPAQKLVDEQVHELPDGTLGPLLSKRMESYDA